MEGKLLENLKNLTARAMLGEYAGDALRNQVMRLWRGVDYVAPEGRVLVLLGASEISSGPSGTTESHVPGSRGTGTAAVAPEACPGRRRHAQYARHGTACPSCGYRRAPASEGGIDQ